VSIDSHAEVLGQVDHIVERIRHRSGRIFAPDIVEAFCGAAATEVFWLEATYPEINVVLRERCGQVPIDLGMPDLASLAQLFCRIIDFRSRFTATHSNGVAGVAARLARLAGFSESESAMMKIAGYLHDLGKLAVPLEILEKPGGLTPNEWHVMKKHPYFTYRVLRAVKGLDTVNSWAACHHELLDGQGYPFHYTAERISLGSRILALSDIFTALTEDRPYRPAVPLTRTVSILRGMREASKLDEDLVELLDSNLEEIDYARATAQAAAVKSYSLLRPSER
jgi:HD-GYP domain-containing protein (c-di-GMP phosphodiesterase class II)